VKPAAPDASTGEVTDAGVDAETVRAGIHTVGFAVILRHHESAGD
jgi:hypothetical protein